MLFIPLITILYSLFRFAPTVYDWLEKRRVYRLYSELKRLEDELYFTAPGGIREDFIERLDRLIRPRQPPFRADAVQAVGIFLEVAH